MKPCQKCDLPLYSAVAFCPFCGTATSAAGRKAAVAAAPVTPPAAAVVAPAAAPVAAPAAAAPSQPLPAPPRLRPAPPAAPKVKPAPAATVELPPVQAPKKGGAAKWFVAALILASVFFFMRSKPDPGLQACNAAFDQGMKALADKDLAAARLQFTAANGVCEGASQTKAASLQAALQEADTANTTCLQGFHLIEGKLDDGKLASARTALYDLSAACAKEPVAAEWRTKLAAAITAAQTAQATLRSALEARDLVQAKSALQQLTRANRENPDLPSLKAEVDQLAAAVALAAEPIEQAPPASAAAASVAPPAAVPMMAIPPAAQAPRERAPARRAESDTAANSKAEMAADFLRDAETALAQKKFDAARTYVDSARRMDPGNPRIDSMNQQIRDRERQVLQQETIIR